VSKEERREAKSEGERKKERKKNGRKKKVKACGISDHPEFVDPKMDPMESAAGTQRNTLLLHCLPTIYEQTIPNELTCPSFQNKKGNRL
jgi:hypothetical protein